MISLGTYTFDSAGSTASAILVMMAGKITFAEDPMIDRLQETAVAAAADYDLTIGSTPLRKAQFVPDPAIRFVMERCEGAFIFLWTDRNQPIAVA